MDIRFNSIENGSWDKLSDLLNYNFNLSELGILFTNYGISRGSASYVGLYTSESDLKKSHSTPIAGQYAFVLGVDGKIFAWLATNSNEWTMGTEVTVEVNEDDYVLPEVCTEPLSDLVGLNIAIDCYTIDNTKLGISITKAGGIDKILAPSTAYYFKLAAATLDEETVQVSNYSITFISDSLSSSVTKSYSISDSVYFRQITSDRTFNMTFSITKSGTVYRVTKTFIY